MKQIFCTLAIVATLFLTCSAVLADNTGLITEMQGNLGDNGLQAGLDAPSGDLTTLIGKIIKAVLSLLFVVLVLLIIYAGWLWMTAGGEPKQVDKAQEYIKNAVIGLIIISLAYAITNFVILKISGATST
jgi:hypothetical protein